MDKTMIEIIQKMDRDMRKDLADLLEKFAPEAARDLNALKPRTAPVMEDRARTAMDVLLLASAVFGIYKGPVFSDEERSIVEMAVRKEEREGTHEGAANRAMSDLVYFLEVVRHVD